MVANDWPTFNPSIASDGDGFRMVVRSENIQDYNRGEVYYNSEIRTNVSYLVQLDGDLQVLAVNQIDEESVAFDRYPGQSVGFQDLRPIRVDGKWWGIGNSWELSPEQRPEMVMVRLEDFHMTDVRPLRWSESIGPEKNWMPFIHQDKLHFIYSCDPTIVLRYEQSAATLSVARRSDEQVLTTTLRGGSQGVPLGKDGFLFVVHETHVQDKRLHYPHRFVRFDSDLRFVEISEPFTFTGDSREFCAGAAMVGSELILSFGVRHTEAWLATLPLLEALALLRPVQGHTPSALANDPSHA